MRRLLKAITEDQQEQEAKMQEAKMHTAASPTNPESQAAGNVKRLVK